jgi:hypothetical protein
MNVFGIDDFLRTNTGMKNYAYSSTVCVRSFKLVIRICVPAVRIEKWTAHNKLSTSLSMQNNI